MQARRVWRDSEQALRKAGATMGFNRKIKTIVDMMFDDIPYSEGVEEAQAKIEAALNAEFDKLSDGRHEDEALEELLGSCGRLSQMAQLAGYPADSAAQWRSEGEAVDIRPLKKELWKQRRRVYISAAFCVFALVQVMWLIYNLFVSPLYAVWSAVYVAIDLLIAFFPFRNYLRTEKAAAGSIYSYSKDLKALKACYAEIEHTHPDLKLFIQYCIS